MRELLRIQTRPERAQGVTGEFRIVSMNDENGRTWRMHVLSPSLSLFHLWSLSGVETLIRHKWSVFNRHNALMWIVPNNVYGRFPPPSQLSVSSPRIRIMEAEGVAYNASGKDNYYCTCPRPTFTLFRLRWTTMNCVYIRYTCYAYVEKFCCTGGNGNVCVIQTVDEKNT